MSTRFSFRQKFDFPSVGGRLPFDEESVELSRDEDAVIVLRSRQGKALKDSSELDLWGTGFPDETTARSAGVRWVSVVQRWLAALGAPANFGTRNPSSGGFTPTALRLVEDAASETSPSEGKVAAYNDSWDLMVFPSEPAPVFIGASGVGLTVRAPAEAALAGLTASTLVDQPVDEVAFDLYGASARVSHVADARLVLLVMAVERLAVRKQRPAETRAHLDRLVQMTLDAPKLDAQERGNLSNALRSLKSESTGSAIRRLMGGTSEADYHFDPAAVVKSAMRMRNDLVHGGTRPDLDEVRRVGAELELIVGSLIAGDQVGQAISAGRASGPGT